LGFFRDNHQKRGIKIVIPSGVFLLETVAFLRYI